MAKKMCIAMVLSKTIKVEGVYVDIEMSKGIVGVMTVYESKKAAREIVGNKIPLVELTIVEQEEPDDAA